MGKITVRCKNPDCFYHNEKMVIPDNVPAFPCPICGAEMIAEEKKHWLAEAAEDPELWADDVENSCPSVIAYEYRQLRKYCREQKAYAVLLSLKDNFEVLFKLETLLAFAWAGEQLDDTFQKETIALLTMPNLSLGAWLGLSKLLVGNVRKYNQALPAGEKKYLPEVIPLNALRILYEKNRIVNWRNARVGHGSMQLEEDQDFRSEVLEKIRALKEIFEKTGEKLKQQKLFCGSLILAGADRARGLDPDLEGKIGFRAGSVSFSADPFIVIRKHEKRGKGVYFFDNQKAPTLTLLQAYPEGCSLSEEIGYFARLRSMLEHGNIHSDARPDDVYLSAEESRELDLLQMSHKFVTPAHLAEWLGRCVEIHTKGVFLLQMGRGMGKSVFTEQLNLLNRNPLEIRPDLDVRTYHFSRTQTAMADDLESRTEWMWSHSYEGKTDWSRAPRIRDLKKQAEERKQKTRDPEQNRENTAAQALCDFLGEVKNYSSARRGRGRILMVMDGLDEILNEKGWSYIPTEKQLPEGVFILLTSRDPGEESLPEFVVNHLKNQQVQETLQIGKTSGENDSFLRDYIRTTKLKKLDGDHARFLFSLADHRVLQLGLYCRLLENGMPWEELPDAGHAVSAYLRLMEERLGEKEAIFAREILAILCTLGSLEPLKIRDLGNMTRENGVTFHLIGMLRDLSPFLKADRSEEGTKYTIVNSDVAEELARQLPETEDTVRSLVRTAMAFLNSGYPLAEAWPEPMTAHVTELAQKWLPEKTEAMGEDAIPVLSGYTAAHKRQMKQVHERERFCEYRYQLYRLCAGKKGEEDPETLKALGSLAAALSNMGRDEEALEMRKQVYEIRKQAAGAQDPETLKAWGDLAVSLSKLGKDKEALQMREKVCETTRQVLGEEHPDTLKALGNLSVSLSKLGKDEEALTIRKKVYETRKQVLGEEHPDTLKSMGNLSVSLSKLGRDEEALEMRKQVYEIRKRILGAEHPDTLRSSGNLAFSLSKLGKDEEALEMRRELCETRKSVLGSEHPDTLKALSNLAFSLSKLGRSDEALQLYRKVYESRKRILGPEHPDTLKTKKFLDEILSKNKA